MNLEYIVVDSFHLSDNSDRRAQPSQSGFVESIDGHRRFECARSRPDSGSESVLDSEKIGKRLI